jgi:hypothetical protein
MSRELRALRKRLPAGPACKPITPSLDRLWNLIEHANVAPEPPPHPRQKWIDLGLEREGGTPLSWHDHKKKKG